MTPGGLGIEDDIYAPDRFLQTLEIAELARLHACNNPTVVLGDFNGQPYSAQMALFEVCDAMSELKWTTTLHVVLMWTMTLHVSTEVDNVVAVANRFLQVFEIAH